MFFFVTGTHALVLVILTDRPQKIISRLGGTRTENIPIFFANISSYDRCARIDNEMGLANVDIDHRRTVESRDVVATKNGRWG
jgi:hypothetical protein